MTAQLSAEDFIPASDGSAARFFGGVDDFSFQEVDPDADLSDERAEFEGYLEAVDGFLRSIG